MKHSLVLKIVIAFLAFLFYGYTASAIVNPRTVAILDLTINNAESNGAELFSIKHILKVAGVPFIVTTNVDTAIKYGVLIASSQLKSTTLTDAEKNLLITYVTYGGCFIAPNVKDPYLYPVFGLSGSSNSTAHFRISFNMGLNDPSFRWLNDPLEQTLSLGDSSEFTAFLNTRTYTTSGAVTLADFNDGTTAITKFDYGSGKTYALGFSFKNLISVNQTNRDNSAQRIYSNGFEPTSDAVILFIKAICSGHISNSAWLHTSPFNSKSTLMVTHDVDASSAFDTMHYYADYENSRGFAATYLITTHYLDDECMADYFVPENYPKVQYLLDKGHTLGSHSVGHFGDFDNETIAPYGTLGNTSANYLPYDSCIATPTSGSTVLGETEVSKNLLESLFGVTVKTFRAGYLCFNDKLTNALDTLGYQYHTTASASDVLTNFPFQAHKDRLSSSMEANVWEVPMTISDVFHEDLMSVSNYPEKVALWLDVILRNKANYAPNVLLIHPTRLFKLQAQQDLIDQLPADIMICDLETYADYWKQRNNIEFRTLLSGDSLIVIIPAGMLPLDSAISFIIDNGQDLALIKAQDDLGNPIAVLQSDWDDNGIILHFANSFPSSLTEIERASEININCFPNPFSTETTIEILVKIKSQIQLSICTLMGQEVMTFESKTLQPGTFQYIWNPLDLSSGIYLCRLSTGDKTFFKKLVYTK